MQVAALAGPGDQVLVMSNGGFEGIHQRLLDALAGTGLGQAPVIPVQRKIPTNPIL